MGALDFRRNPLEIHDNSHWYAKLFTIMKEILQDCVNFHSLSFFEKIACEETQISYL